MMIIIHDVIAKSSPGCKGCECVKVCVSACVPRCVFLIIVMDNNGVTTLPYLSSSGAKKTISFKAERFTWKAQCLHTAEHIDEWCGTRELVCVRPPECSCRVSYVYKSACALDTLLCIQIQR